MKYDKFGDKAICGTKTAHHSVNYPEEFWSCSDIKIEGACVVVESRVLLAVFDRGMVSKTKYIHVASFVFGHFL